MRAGSVCEVFLRNNGLDLRSVPRSVCELFQLYAASGQSITVVHNLRNPFMNNVMHD